MQYARGRHPDEDRSDTIDLDDLTDAIGGPLWIPAGNTVCLAASGWNSRTGVENVRLVTRNGSGARDRVETHGRPLSYNALRAMAEDVCTDNRTDLRDLKPPVFPDDISISALVLHDERSQCYVVNWGTVRLLLFKNGRLRTYIGSLTSEAPIERVIQGTGRHGVIRRAPPQ